MLIKFLNILKKSNFKFSNPKNTDVLIFDDESSGVIKNLLSNFKYFTLKTRPEKIDTLYLTLKVIFFSFFYYRGNILSSYLISIISIIKPKVVITYIDNSLKFSEVAFRFKKINKKIKFIAVQNGSRYEILENEFLFKNRIIKENINKKFYIPTFLTFGNYENHIYKKFKIRVKRSLPVGSLALEKYNEYKKKNKIKIKKKKQICLLSDHGAWHSKMNKADNKIEKNFILLTNFCIKFSKKYNYKIKICQKRMKDNNLNNKKIFDTDYYREKEAFKKYLNQKYYSYFTKSLLKRDRNIYKTYLNVEESEVLISTMSTMLRENLFLRNKILAANLTGNSIYDFPVKGFFSFNNKSYENFEKKLLSIIKMSKETYFKKIGKNTDYCIIKNKSPSKKIISVIKSCL